MTWFLQALVDQRRDELICDGIKGLVVAYYDEYSDADQIDPSTLQRLRAIEELCDDLHINDFDLVGIVTAAEQDVLRDTGRRVRTFTDDEEEGATDGEG